MKRKMGSDDETSKRTIPDKILIKKMLKYLFVHKKLMMIALLMMIIQTVFFALGPYMIKIILDNYITQGRRTEFLIFGFLYLVFVILRVIPWYVQRWLLLMVGEKAIHNIRRDTYEKLQDISMEYFDKTPAGDSLARMTSDIASIQPILSGEFLMAFSSLFMVVGGLIVCFSISLPLTLLTLSLFPVIITFAIFQRRFVRKKWDEYREFNAKYISSMAEQISGARVSQSFARYEHNRLDFDKLNEEYYQKGLTAFRWSSIFGPFYETYTKLTIVLVLFVGGTMTLETQGAVTVGSLVLFILYLNSFLEPLMIIAGLYALIQTSFSAFERIVILLDTPLSVAEKVHAKQLDCHSGKIDLKKVTFSYGEGESMVLDDFDLSIQPNERIAIVGETGSGKTTIISLISRLYDIQEGSIQIDGQDIRNVTLSSLRKSVGVVLQEPFLFSESVRYNLCYGKEASNEEIKEVLKLVSAEFVYDLPEDLDTKVGERGGWLSMGQRQLVSFARALITDPKIILLDEATSSIDPQAELRIQRALSKMLKNRTSIIIAHRLSTVRAADRIIVLDKGKIIEEGTFDELLAQHGEFYNLYKLQFRHEE
ncbi:MAG: ABC transporter ATP-binding protein [Promethearchaeota archaeon]|jgi:ATP-binding cassette subfamily B protein